MGAIGYIALDGTADWADTPDLSTVDDFSVVGLIAYDDWTPAGPGALMAQYNPTTTQRSWRFGVLGATGVLRLVVSTNGSSATGNHDSTVAPTITDGQPLWILVTRNKAAGEVKFYTAPYVLGSVSIPAIGSFTQLGTTVTGVTTSSLFNSSAVVSAGAAGDGSAPTAGKLYRAALYTGIYGSGSESLQRDCNAVDWSSGSTWTSASTAETWTLRGDAAVVELTYADATTATGTGTANNPQAQAAPSPTTGTGTGTANSPSALLQPGTDTATGTGAAGGPTATVAPTPTTATGTGTANDPAAGVSVTPTTATGTGAAADPTPAVAPTPTTATGSGQANDAATTAAITPSTATGAGQANDATPTLAPGTGVATGTGAAGGPTATVAPTPGTATGSGQAFDATVITAPGATDFPGSVDVSATTAGVTVSATVDTVDVSAVLRDRVGSAVRSGKALVSSTHAGSIV